MKNYSIPAYKLESVNIIDVLEEKKSLADQVGSVKLQGNEFFESKGLFLKTIGTIIDYESLDISPST